MKPLYHIAIYTSGPETWWNVIDGSTQEWVRRYPTKKAAQAYADELTTLALHRYDDGQPDEQQEWHDYDRDC
jgi:hypothetical protein